MEWIILIFDRTHETVELENKDKIGTVGLTNVRGVWDSFESAMEWADKNCKDAGSFEIHPMDAF